MKLKSDIIADQPTKKNTIYPKNVLIEALEKFNSRECNLGEFGNSGENYVNINNAIIKIEDAKLEDNQITCSVELIKNLDFINEDDYCVKLRGLGRVDDNGVVQELNIISFDLCIKDEI